MHPIQDGFIHINCALTIYELTEENSPGLADNIYTIEVVYFDNVNARVV